MHPRLYRLTETLQRIERALRREQSRAAPNLVRLVRLEHLKRRARQVIHRFHRRRLVAA